jgi:hypothetical protein
VTLRSNSRAASASFGSTAAKPTARPGYRATYAAMKSFGMRRPQPVGILITTNFSAPPSATPRR